MRLNIILLLIAVIFILTGITYITSYLHEVDIIHECKNTGTTEYTSWTGMISCKDNRVVISRVNRD